MQVSSNDMNLIIADDVSDITGIFNLFDFLGNKWKGAPE